MFTLHQLDSMARSSLDQRGVTNCPTHNLEDVKNFPVLRQRNVWCIQRHWATAPHYDLRLSLRDGLHSWAIPKGLVGLSPGEVRLAIQTAIHPPSYLTFEGGDQTRAGRGTLLWDVGFYTIADSRVDPDSPSDEADPDGAFEMEKLDLALKKISSGKKRSILISLQGGRRDTYAAFMLTYSGHDHYNSTGERRRDWLVRLPAGVDDLDWDAEGEEGLRYGRSVKSKRRKWHYN
ncbi:uncharacterized protein COLE_06170 [Cutaneotrichosporon oleaginosum]|uniref:uncharacterized protein n=1 Tax=Cutaneotrichosporon oleaginosum TaxID=879819 RepID=UPI001321BDB3|nr:hypothetical protein COLE_06170 [Cutaneotrichosporon oleaginosum]